MKMIAPAPGALFIGLGGACRSNARDSPFEAVAYVRYPLGSDRRQLAIRGGIVLCLGVEGRERELVPIFFGCDSGGDDAGRHMLEEQ